MRDRSMDLRVDRRSMMQLESDGSRECRVNRSVDDSGIILMKWNEMTYGNWLRLRRQWGSRFCRRSEDVGRCTSQSHTATRPACKLR